MADPVFPRTTSSEGLAPFFPEEPTCAGAPPDAISAPADDSVGDRALAGVAPATLSVHVWREEGDRPRFLAGHAWVAYNPAGAAPASFPACGLSEQDFGTFPGNGSPHAGSLPEPGPSAGGGILPGRDTSRTPDVTFTKTLTEREEESLVVFLNDPANAHWGLLSNCSSFAQGAWESAGGHVVGNRTWNVVPNPNQLADDLSVFSWGAGGAPPDAHGTTGGTR